MYFLLFTLLSGTGVEAWLWGSKTECYGDLGCFSNSSPFDNALRKLPQSPAVIQTRFLLYTRLNRLQYQLLDSFDSASVTGSNFNGAHKTVFIIHGYSDDGENAWIKDMTAELLIKGDMNVIAVDWSGGSQVSNYYQAAANTRVVGAQVGKMMARLHTAAAATYSNMHLVGHSLGSHIAGYAGEVTTGLGRITGLDPAGLAFQNQAVEVRLDPTDASFVDVIHTNGKEILDLGLGSTKPIGDADFYPNGGEDQPGCPSSDIHIHLINLLTGQVNFPDLKSDVACSHMRVLDLFKESINSACSFQAHPCASWDSYTQGQCTTCGSGCNTMGYNSNPNVHGRFYLSTAPSKPFCQNSG